MKIFIYNVTISVVSGLALLPLWFSSKLTDSSIQIIFSMIILPIILCSFNIFMFLKGKVSSFYMLYFIMPIACIINQFVGYFNWGLSTSNFKPDPETIILMKYFIILSIIIPVILCGVSHLILFVTKKL